MSGDSYKMLLRLSFAGLAEMNPFIQFWLAIVAPPVHTKTNTEVESQK